MSYSAQNVPVELQGIDTATLTTWRTQAQTALNALLTGKQAVEVTYSQGEGNRSVRYTQAKVPELRQYIRNLSLAIGDVPMAGRRAIGLRF